MSSRTPLIAGNWKMYKTGPEASEAAGELVRLVGGAAGVDVMIAPPYTALEAVGKALSGSHIALGAQNVHWEAEGAFTGEVSPGMLAAAGCRFVIVGHSERRQYFGETDATVNRKIRSVLDTGMIPVFCVGETESQREAGDTFSVLDKQIQMGLEEVFLEGRPALVVAYEPVWAIGTGKTATSDQAQEVHDYIRGLLARRFDDATAAAVRILYGGSVKPGNAKELMAQPDVDGALVGGASLEPETFSQIVLFQND